MMGRRSLVFISLASLSGPSWSYIPPSTPSVCSSLPRRGAISTKRLGRTVAPTSRLTTTETSRCSLLFSSNIDNSNDSNKPSGKRNPLLQVKKVLTRFSSKWSRFLVRFRALSRRAKFYVLTQFSIMLVVLGLLGKRTLDKYFNPTIPTSPPIEIPYSTFLDFCQGSHKDVHVSNVLIGDDRIGYKILRTDTDEQRRFLEGKLSPSTSTTTKTRSSSSPDEQVAVEIPQRRAYTRKVSASSDLLATLRENKIPFSAAPTTTNYAALSLRTFIFAFYALLLFRMYQNISGGGAGGSNSPGKLASQSSAVTSASFDDIEGVDEAKYEVMELVDTLRNPDKYAILGARAPTGLLLEGPPGTGKTLLARATAATAGVPLLYCSGSDFVEMFVGRGAARVRKIFEKAAKLAPCIIFIDELDALGKSRDSGMMGMQMRSNDEAEQTLNQLLACMDGLDSSKRVCVMAATNRKDVLDSALVRPGRFDRIIKLELPSTVGREKILRVHASKLPGFLEGRGIDDKRPGSLGKGRAVDLSAVAASTPGLSGAELEFIVNEAAIRAVRRVSSELQQGQDPATIVPTVEAIDFEESVRNFYETRRSKGGAVSDLFRGLTG